MISGLFLAPSLNVVKTRANFQACENIPVVMETFILKGKLELIVVQPPPPPSLPPPKQTSITINQDQLHYCTVSQNAIEYLLARCFG